MEPTSEPIYVSPASPVDSASFPTRAEAKLINSVFESPESREQALAEIAAIDSTYPYDWSCWEANVPKEIVALWAELSVDAKIVAYLMGSTLSTHTGYRE